MTVKTGIGEFNKWLKQPEGHNLEFKSAKGSFDSKHDLPDYCAALANEGGGRLILGVDPDRKVVGSKAFHGTHNKIAHELYTKIKVRVDVKKNLPFGQRPLQIFLDPEAVRPKDLYSTTA